MTKVVSLRRRALIAAPFAAGSLVFGAKSMAQSAYPSRPIRLVLPFAAGGGTDLNARILGTSMSEGLGQIFVVENRPGGGTIVAADAVAKAAPDGYTLLMSGMPTFAVAPALYPKLPFDPARDFAPIGLVASYGMVLAVPSDSPIRSVKDFLAQARREQGHMAFGSAGIAASNHLAMELLMQLTDVKLQHIPYKGSVLAMQDMLAGRIPAMFIDTATAMSQIKAGRLRIIANVSRNRSPTLPDVPTVAESGVAGYEMAIWQGLVAPAGTPPTIIQRLNHEARKATADPATRQKLAELGIDPLDSTPEEMASLMRAERAKWTAVITKGNIKPE